MSETAQGKSMSGFNPPLSKAEKQLKDQIAAIYRSLPTGSILEARVEPDRLWLNRILLPASHRHGAGSRMMARILDAADRAGVTVGLEADPTDNPGDPTTFDLVRWYRRFDFKPLCETEDGVLMERDSRAPRGVDKLLAAAMAAPRWSHDDFISWRHSIGPSSSSRTPTP
jgi:hypothetical protein